MTELLALTSRHLRTTLRGTAARAGAVLFVLALGAILLLPDAASGGLVLLAGLLVLTLFVSGLSVGAGGTLPEDRVAGREAWLAALAPPAWKRRLAVLLSAWFLTVSAGLLGGLVIGAVALFSNSGLVLHAHDDVPLPPEALLARGAEPVTIALSGAGEVEIEVRPLYRLQGVPVDRVRVTWQAGSKRGEIEASARGPLRFVPPTGATAAALRLHTDRIRLRLTEARRLRPLAAPLLAIVWAGLLLGVLAAAVAPVAVFISRATTGQTASACAFVLLLFGAARHDLLQMAADVDPGGWLAFVPGLLRGVAWIAPDAPLLRLVGEAGALRAPGLGDVGLLAPALGYTLLAAVPACVAAPLGLARGVNA